MSHLTCIGPDLHLGVEERNTEKEEEDTSLSLRRFWQRYRELPLRDRWHTALGVLRFYLRYHRFDGPGPAVIGRDVLVGKRPPARLVLGRGVRVSHHCRLVVGSGRSPGWLEIGPRTIIGPYTRITAATRVQIGARCMISWNCSIFDSLGHRMWLEGQDEAEIEAPISIEDDVWIGPYAIIMKGVTVGAGSIIGAGSVVRRDVPPKSLAYGNPARIVGRVARWER